VIQHPSFPPAFSIRLPLGNRTGRTASRPSESLRLHRVMRFSGPRKIRLYPEPFLLPTDAHNVKKRRVIKTF